MSYILLNHIRIDKRPDFRECPWQILLMGVLMPERKCMDMHVSLDPRKYPDPRRYTIPNVVSRQKMFPRSARGQYRSHRVFYNLIRPEGMLWPKITH